MVLQYEHRQSGGALLPLLIMGTMVPIVILLLSGSYQKSAQLTHHNLVNMQVRAIKQQILGAIDCDATARVATPSCPGAVNLLGVDGNPISQVGDWTLETSCRINNGFWLEVRATRNRPDPLTRKNSQALIFSAGDQNDSLCWARLNVGPRYILQRAQLRRWSRCNNQCGVAGSGCCAILDRNRNGSAEPSDCGEHWYTDTSCPAGYENTMGGYNCAAPSAAYPGGEGAVTYNRRETARRWRHACCIPWWTATRTHYSYFVCTRMRD